MWYYNSKDIRDAHIEITNFCNARCPDCPRENLGIDNTTGKSRFPDWIDKDHLSLETFKNNFNQTLTPNILQFSFCGCFGDALAHPKLLEFIEYVVDEFPYARITIATNGGLKTKQYWEKIAHALSKAWEGYVIWGLDGLEDTNHLYRVNVKWEKVQENFRAFNAAGGKSIWQTIVFPHNYHQLQEIKDRAIAEGFGAFKTIYSYRHTDEVKAMIPENLTHNVDVGDDFKIRTYKLTTKQRPPWKGVESIGFDYFVKNTNTKIVCESQNLHKIFLKSDGTLWPCNKIGAWRWRLDEGYLNQQLEEDTNARFINNLNNFRIDNVMKNDFWKGIYESHKSANFCKACIEECGRINDKDVYQTKDTEEWVEL
jgi:MoaA/NifB/PqqE/SkfB family radical SAM enzyme